MSTQILPREDVVTLFEEASGRPWIPVCGEALFSYGGKWAIAAYTSQKRPDLRVLLLREPDPENFTDTQMITSWVLESGDEFIKRYPSVMAMLECKRAKYWMRTGIWQTWRDLQQPAPRINVIAFFRRVLRFGR